MNEEIRKLQSTIDSRGHMIWTYEFTLTNLKHQPHVSYYKDYKLAVRRLSALQVVDKKRIAALIKTNRK